MKIVVTCAHAGPLDLLLARSDYLAQGLYRDRERRRQELHESLDVICRLAEGLAPVHVLECHSRWKPFHLRSRGDCKVWRARTRVPTLSKGVREFLNLASFLRMTEWPSHEMICKVTGRYLPRTPEFFHACASTSHQALVRKDSDVWGDKGRGVHTFLFGARVGVIVGFAEWLREEGRISALGKGPVEWPFAEYLGGSDIDTGYYHQSLKVFARFSPPLSPKEI